MAVTPIVGVNTQVSISMASVEAVPANPNGGLIVNPLLATDQGIPTAEGLYVDIVSNCSNGFTPAANGTICALQPGQTWTVLAGQTTPTYVNALTGGHKFTSIYW